jgi:hypothetical protein
MVTKLAVECELKSTRLNTMRKTKTKTQAGLLSLHSLQINLRELIDAQKDRTIHSIKVQQKLGSKYGEVLLKTLRQVVQTDAKCENIQGRWNKHYCINVLD